MVAALDHLEVCYWDPAARQRNSGHKIQLASIYYVVCTPVIYCTEQLLLGAFLFWKPATTWQKYSHAPSYYTQLCGWRACGSLTQKTERTWHVPFIQTLLTWCNTKQVACMWTTCREGYPPLNLKPSTLWVPEMKSRTAKLRSIA